MGTIGTAVRHRVSRAGALLLLVAAWSQVDAMTNAEVCSLRAGFVESAAHMRDAGKSEAQVLKETKAAYKKQLKRDPPASLNDYVKASFHWQTVQAI